MKFSKKNSKKNFKKKYKKKYKKLICFPFFLTFFLYVKKH